jgi:hypothetical protein
VYWPTDTGTMADLMNGIPKLVVSATLDRADWQNTSIARDGLEAARCHCTTRSVRADVNRGDGPR